jgi:hypothetical protein
MCLNHKVSLQNSPFWPNVRHPYLFIFQFSRWLGIHVGLSHAHLLLAVNQLLQSRRKYKLFDKIHSFLNSVGSIFTLSKQGAFHETYQSAVVYKYRVLIN